MTGKLTSIKVIKELLAQNNFAPRKSLGQNFLIDQNILMKIINVGSVCSSDLVLEVGPGLGVLTAELLERAGMVVAVEYDRGFYSFLKQNFSDYHNFKLENHDILKLNLGGLLEVYQEKFKSLKVIANLPYYITTPVIFSLLESKIPWSKMVFMVQKEVAQRLVAAPGSNDYSALTVMLSFCGRVELVGNVPKTVFYPSPQVDSAIVSITPGAVDWELYPYLHRVVKAAFGQRRKMILNALAAGEAFFSNKMELQAVLEQLAIDSSRRGETLTLTEFLGLATELQARS